MAELFVRLVDKVHPDPYRDVHCLKRGDVVVACPDGWSWGRLERASMDHLIVSVPALSLEEAQGMLGPELDVDSRQPSRVLRRRAARLDVDHADFGPTLTLDQFRALRQRKSPLTDPGVIG